MYLLNNVCFIKTWQADSLVQEVLDWKEELESLALLAPALRYMGSWFPVLGLPLLAPAPSCCYSDVAILFAKDYSVMLIFPRNI